MDNVKNDDYYITKIKDNLQFICKYMENVSKEQFNDNELIQNSMSFDYQSSSCEAFSP